VKNTLRVLAIIALLVLVTQTVRHVYVRWIAPRHSALDRFDRPMHDRISAAKSLGELVALYEPARKAVDSTRKAAKGKADHSYAAEHDQEPYLSEWQLREAIQEWESHSRQLRELWFYWGVSIVMLILGTGFYRWRNRWAGLALEIAAFSEFIYWTSPNFVGGTAEFDRLLTQKIIFSVLSLMLLVVIIRTQGALSDE
jgi:hypothetical protein